MWKRKVLYMYKKTEEKKKTCFIFHFSIDIFEFVCYKSNLNIFTYVKDIISLKNPIKHKRCFLCLYLSISTIAIILWSFTIYICLIYFKPHFWKFYEFYYFISLSNIYIFNINVIYVYIYSSIYLTIRYKKIYYFRHDIQILSIFSSTNKNVV